MNLRGAFRLLVSVAMLFGAWQVAGGGRVLDVLGAAHWPWLAVALALTVPMQLLSALRWTLTCARIGEPLGFRRAVNEYYLASLLNMVLPGGVVGDATRVWRQGTHDGTHGGTGYRRAAHGVILERTAGQAALVVVLLAGIACNPAALEHLAASPWRVPVAVTIVVLAAVAVVAVRRWRFLGTLPGDARRAFTPALVFLAQALLSLGVVTTYLVIFAATAAALGSPLSPATALLAIPLVLTAMAVPISVGGTGPRELSAAALWPLLGLDPASGAATALAYGLVVLLGSLPGAVVLLRARQQAGPAGG